MTTKTVISAIHYHFCESRRCAAECDAGTTYHITLIQQICNDLLPHGNGFNSGVGFLTMLSKDNKIILSVPYHHYDKNGFDDGWTDHYIEVTPAFDGINLKITGKNKNNVKDYLRDVMYDNLLKMVELGSDGKYKVKEKS